MGAALASLTVLVAPFNNALSAGSAPVTVVNPDTSPVPTTVLNPATMPALTSSVDDPGRIAYQSTGGAQCPNSPVCDFSFPSVPEGHRLVVQHISGSLQTNGAPVSIRIALTSGPHTNISFAPFAASTPAPLFDSDFNEPVLLYFDAGNAGNVPEASAIITGSTLARADNVFVTITGYILNCTVSVSPCTPIAH